MDWINRMNLALDYIENHLSDEIDMTAVANKAFSSQFHFQKMFAALAGLTPAEYIRRRRFTLAAAELIASKTKVVDIALKYGYQSPNAFTRAFRKVHGVNPSAVRNREVKLAAYKRISFNDERRGGDYMNYRIIKKPAFEVLGKSKKFTHEKFFKDAPKFWKEYVSKKEYGVLTGLSAGKSGLVSEAPLMSVYIPQEDGSREEFTDALCIEKSQSIEPGNFDVFHIPAASYAEFQCTYSSAKKVNKYIYGEWFAATGYERDEGKPDIAAYFPIPFRPMKDMIVRWWIPILDR